MDVDAVREVIRETFSTIPLPDQEELVKQVSECVSKYGVLRVASIGTVVERLLEREVIGG